MSALIIVLVLLVSVGGYNLWSRFGNDGIEDWMLAVEGLDGVCTDYLEYINMMKSGLYDVDTIRELDSQRQVTHDQLLSYLELDRSSPLDMEACAKRYLDQS